LDGEDGKEEVTAEGDEADCDMEEGEGRFPSDTSGLWLGGALLVWVLSDAVTSELLLCVDDVEKQKDETDLSNAVLYRGRSIRSLIALIVVTVFVFLAWLRAAPVGPVICFGALPFSIEILYG
jgi:hypothetical protein